MVTGEQIADAISCGPDAAPILERAREYIKAGFDHVYFHQVGLDQKGFIDFASRELLPRLGRAARSAA